MTPEQLTALREACQQDAGALALLQAGDANGLREYLNGPGGSVVRSRFITARTVLAEIGPDGAIILEKLEAVAPTVPAVKWAMRFITQDSGIDIGHPGTQGMTDMLVAGGALTADEGAALKALALQPITRAEALLPGVGNVSGADAVALVYAADGSRWVE